MLSFLYLLPGKPFDIFQEAALFCRAKGECIAASSCPAGAPDAVDVALWLIWQVIVHHMGDIIDIYAPSGDVGRHQHPYPA